MAWFLRVNHKTKKAREAGSLASRLDSSSKTWRVVNGGDLQTHHHLMGYVSSRRLRTWKGRILCGLGNHTTPKIHHTSQLLPRIRRSHRTTMTAMGRALATRIRSTFAGAAVASSAMRKVCRSTSLARFNVATNA